MDDPHYRLLAIDLDGTLLSPAGDVTPRTRAAVHSALAAGLRICFATGRNWTESRLVLDAVAHYPCAVFVGGAMVIDTRQRLTLHRTLMDARLAADLCRVLEAMGHAVLALQDTGAAGVDYLIADEATLNRATANWMRTTRTSVRSVGRLSNYRHDHTVRVGIVADPAEARRVHAALNEQFARRMLGQVLHIPGSNHEVLEIFDPHVNKWQGVLHVAQRHGVRPEQIIAIGDDVNDLPMITNAGLGVAMGNAKPEVRTAAGRVIGSNREEGLAAFLEELIVTNRPGPVRNLLLDAENLGD